MKSNQYDTQTSQKYCQVCGIKIEMHLCCAGCGILIGPTHVETVEYLLKKLAYCSTCYKSRGGKLDE